MTAATEFDPALADGPARMVRSDGAEVMLAVGRWRGPAGGEDTWLLDRCTGPAIDLGCGPGRLVAALAERGIPALGVDASATAAEQCRRRSAAVLRRDLFAPLPDEGTWQHVLLADGNIGIGGDPTRLLRRAATLLRPRGTVLVETDPRAETFWTGTVRLHTSTGLGAPLPWAVLGVAALAAFGDALGMRTTAVHRGARCFAELTVGAV